MRFATQDGVVFEIDRAHRRARRIRGREQGTYTKIGDWREYAWIQSFDPFSRLVMPGEVSISPGWGVQIMWGYMINGVPYNTITAPVLMVSLDKKRIPPPPLPRGIEQGPYHHAT